jgi:hypothetical protein
MKLLNIMLLIVISLYCSTIFAEVQTTTTIENTAAPSAVIAPPVATAPATTTVTTVTKDSSIPSPADDNIVSAVYTKFSKTAALVGTNLTVTSLNGTVTINGIVTAQVQADAALEAAQSIPGVNDVKSNIKVTTNPEQPSQAAPKY